MQVETPAMKLLRQDAISSIMLIIQKKVPLLDWLMANLWPIKWWMPVVLNKIKMGESGLEVDKQLMAFLLMIGEFGQKLLILECQMYGISNGYAGKSRNNA